MTPRRAALLLAVALVAGSLTGAIPVQGAIEPMTAVPLDVAAEVREYPASRDGRTYNAAWRVVNNIGNDLESYLMTTPDGRILELGGSFPNVSDDAGQTWTQYQVPPSASPMSLLAAEGAIAATPDGDVVAMTWDLYDPDKIYAYFGEAETGEWTWQVVTLHQPFYDRPFVTVIPGPITLDGVTHDWVSVITGSLPKDVLLVSTDGLNYQHRPESLPWAATASSTEPLHPVASDFMDYSSPMDTAEIIPLGGGQALLWSWYLGWQCPGQMLVSTGGLQWQCHAPPGAEPIVWTAADSAGRLHGTQWNLNQVTYVMSADGGATVRHYPLELPDGYEVTSQGHRDVAVNAAVGLVAIAVHASHSETGRAQDFVFTFEDVPNADAPVPDRVLLLGDGDRVTSDNVFTTDQTARFDFASVAILPDGCLAVSFQDVAHAQTSVAVELPASADHTPQERPCHQ